MSEHNQHYSPKRVAQEPWEMEEIAALGIEDDVWERMQRVEQIFRDAPMVDAPPNFADNVMLLIASRDFDDGTNSSPNTGSKRDTKRGGKPGSSGGSKPRKLFFFMSALGTAVVGTLVMALVANSTVGYALAQALALAFSEAWESVVTSWSYATHVAPTTVLLPLLLISTVAMIGTWWVTISVLSKRQQVVYHIPVRFE